MKREIAATIFSLLLAGTALAGPIETSELAPPAQNNAGDADPLRGLIDDTLRAEKRAPSTQTQQHEDWNIHSSAELWLDGIPEAGNLSLDALAQKARPRPVQETDRTLPTSFGWNHGNWKANVGTNVATASTAPTVIPTDHYAGNITPSGGTGELAGRLEYDINTWQFYGGTKRALVANPDGTLAVNNNFSGGTYYNLPPALLGGKVGTGFEVNPLGDSKTTKLEYRQMFGSTEGFLSAERTTPWMTHPGLENTTTGVNALKGGINRKF